MNAIRELLATSTVLAVLALAVGGSGPVRVMLTALSMLAWAQAVVVGRMIGIRVPSPLEVR